MHLQDEAEVLDDGRLALWPDNVQAVHVFRRMLTQWNVAGFGGFVGLRYESMRIVLDVCGVEREQWPEVVDCVQLMERHALSLLNEDRSGGR